MTTRPVHASLVLLLLSLPGCLVTTSKFELLEARVAVLEKEKVDLADEQKRSQARMEKLNDSLQEATEALRKGGANLGADVDALKADVARLRGADEEQSYGQNKQREDIDAIKRILDEKLGAPVVQLPPGLPTDRDPLFKAGKAAFDKGDWPTARGILRKFLDTFPDEPRAAEAGVLIGESFLKEGKFGQATAEFQRVFNKFQGQKGAPVPRALLGIAQALQKQGDCKKAGGVLKLLIEYDRKAPESEQAKDQLKALKKKCQGL